MGKYLLKLPKMGESIAEATITKWLKEVGDEVEVDESIVEIATDKVDSDVPTEFKGKLIKKNFEVNDIVKVNINLRGREWVNPEGETKYFNSIQAWRIEKVGDDTISEISSTLDNNFEKSDDADNEVEDDLPF